MIDMFKYTVTLRTRRNPSFRPGKHMYFGSVVGAFMTVCVVTSLGSYAIY